MNKVLFKDLTLEPGKEMLNFFQLCLHHELHNKPTTENSSRLYLIFTQRELCVGANIVLATLNDNPIGIAFVERRDQRFEKAINETTKQESPIYNLGFLHIFVKPDHRELGIGTHLVKRIEKHCLKQMKENLTIEANHIPIFIGHGKSFEFGKKHNKESHIIFNDCQSKQRQKELNLIKSSIDGISQYEKLIT